MMMQPKLLITLVILAVFMNVIDAAETDCTLPSQPSGFAYAGTTGLFDCTSSTCDNPKFTGISCDSSYFGNVETSGCTAANPEVTLTGCDTTCVLPGNQKGYAFTGTPALSDCTSASCDNPTFTGISCDSGYFGNVATSGCTVDKSVVTLTGCDAITNCAFPNSQDGYGINGKTLTDCTSANCKAPEFNGVVCAVGYDGTVATSGCTAGNSIVTLTGCDITNCTFPNSQDGYDINGKTLAACTSANCNAPDFNGVVCAVGYDGTVATSGCTAGNAEVTLTGCGIKCVLPEVGDQPGYDFTNTPILNDCTSLLCDNPGYTGGTVSCETNYGGNVAISACAFSDATVYLTGCDCTINGGLDCDGVCGGSQDCSSKRVSMITASAKVATGMAKMASANSAEKIDGGNDMALGASEFGIAMSDIKKSKNVETILKQYKTCEDNNGHDDANCVSKWNAIMGIFYAEQSCTNDFYDGLMCWIDVDIKYKSLPGGKPPTIGEVQAACQNQLMSYISCFVKVNGGRRALNEELSESVLRRRE